MAQSIQILQLQFSSLAEITLQNRWALDLLTAEKAETCSFLGEECCYYVNESGKVEQNIQHLQKAQNLSQRTLNGEGLSGWGPWAAILPLLTTLLGPLTVLVILCTVAPCLL